ncbi:hypothetical protein I545_4849 [Mycobacterium kansasii 662]|uniref:Uncharacterized protein n=2 Tax=Mycobacterium kansasii TaxID=1768 RepID=A0A1V3WCV6_MYCKA|nr:hypothetical protein I545_4849 [Mycobacterium kansasii 662]KEP44715.1 hypothetical protein MKSMC1_01760 [Mycobacterium kansasii]OOK64598.1 hypothetical protein BZL30_9028 [Mycobacterium kansasii]
MRRLNQSLREIDIARLQPALPTVVAEYDANVVVFFCVRLDVLPPPGEVSAVCIG